MNETKDEQSLNTNQKSPKLSLLLLYLYSLWGFVVAQPIYSDLFKDGGFFRWYKFQISDIWLAVFLISFGFPSFWMLALWELNHFFKGFTTNFCRFLISVLISSFCLLCLQKIPELSYFLKLVIAIPTGVQLTRLLLRSKDTSFLLYFLVPAAIFFPIWFLATCPLTTPFIKPETPIIATQKSILPRNTPPVVMVVFDELPLNSLLDENGQIDSVNYPNFAALAQQATWFPNAVTVHSITRGAVPAILTGNNPKVEPNWMSLLSGQNKALCKNPIPTINTFPNTLFTLLEKSYNLHIFESRIYLCPNADCKQRPLQADRQRIPFMLKRIGEEYFFKILFNSNELNKLYFDYEDIEKQSTVKQLANDGVESDMSPIAHDYDIQLYANFLKAIQAPEPHKMSDFYFIHPVLPHSPWEFYPSGKRYPAWRMVNLASNVLCENTPSLQFCINPAHSKSQYQRHLLQVGYADNLLGQMIAKLKAANLYDRALIVITADHGVSFMPHQFRRTVTLDNYGEILSIPLIIKKPTQHVGQINMRQAEIIDIVPSIADILDIPPYWYTDGLSLFQPWPRERKSHFFCAAKNRIVLKVSDIGKARQQALQRKLAAFGPLNRHPAEIFNLGIHRQLIGRTLQTQDIRGASTLYFQLSPYLLNEHPRTDHTQVLLNGHLFFPKAYNGTGQVGNIDLAVVINDKIVAVSQPFNYSTEKQQADMAILIPENAYYYGKDTLQLVQVLSSKPDFYRLNEKVPNILQ